MDELLVYEVLVSELLYVVVNVGVFVMGADPGLALVGEGLRERKVDILNALLILLLELNDLLLQVREVIFCFLGG